MSRNNNVKLSPDFECALLKIKELLAAEKAAGFGNEESWKQLCAFLCLHQAQTPSGRTGNTDERQLNEIMETLIVPIFDSLSPENKASLSPLLQATKIDRYSGGQILLLSLAFIAGIAGCALAVAGSVCYELHPPQENPEEGSLAARRISGSAGAGVKDAFKIAKGICDDPQKSKPMAIVGGALGAAFGLLCIGIFLYEKNVTWQNMQAQRKRFKAMAGIREEAAAERR